jgi:hypothetical protein
MNVETIANGRYVNIRVEAKVWTINSIQNMGNWYCIMPILEWKEFGHINDLTSCICVERVSESIEQE